MTIQTQSFSLRGGLDLVRPFLELPPGSLIDALNFEALPLGGYQRIAGYALYDGKTDGEGVVHGAVPGIGPIRSVFNLDGKAYAIRDSASGGGALWRTTTAGWVSVALGTSILYSDANAMFEEGATITGGTSGATATILRAVFAGGFTDQASGQGLLSLGSVSGVFVSGEALTVATVPIALAASAALANALPAGGDYQVRIHNFYGQDNLRRAYGVNGIGPAFEFDGTLFVPLSPAGLSGFPTRLAVHKDHLFLAYPEGSIISSGIGDATNFSVLQGAVEIAVGDQITEMKGLVGGVLLIGCRNKIDMLYGNDSDTWQKQPYVDHGVRSNTVKEIGGQTLALDDRGVQQISATQAYGDFQSNSVSRLITTQVISLLRAQSDAVACVSQNNNQYRIFWGSAGFYFTFDGPKFVGVMPVRFAHPVMVISEGEDTAGNELLLFGTSDGQVMKMDSTNFFAGQPIPSRLQLPFVYQGRHTQRKQYKRAVFDARVEGADAILFGRVLFDLDRAVAQTFDNVTVEAGDSGFWSASNWGEFRWATPQNSQAVLDLEGLGENMSILISNSGTQDTRFAFYGLTLHFSLRRLNR